MPKTTVALPGITNQTQGDIMYVNASGVWTRLPAGTSGQFLQTLGAGNNPAWGTPTISLAYLSAAQTITSAGALTLAHGLGVVPKIVVPYITCTSAENGYSVGESVFINPATNDNGAGRGMAMKFDATNISIKFFSGAQVFAGFNFSTGGSVALTNASWQLYVRALA